MEQIETVIIGGGQAGLAMSYYLGQLGREHVVLERHRVAERWRSERWDSLTFQSPNWNIQLPGFAFEDSDPDAFASSDEVLRFIERYAAFIRAPLRCGLAATALRQTSDSKRLIVEAQPVRFEAKNVVIADRFRCRRLHCRLGAPCCACIPASIAIRNCCRQVRY